MKEVFEYQQHQEYFTNWRTNYYQSPDSFFQEPFAPCINEAPNLTYSYETTLTKSMPEPLLITDQNLPSWLANSQEQQHILLNRDTFYVKDISDRKDTSFNTLVFQFNGPPLKTTEDTRTIMDRYFERKPYRYNFVQYIGKSLGFHMRCPFVSGYDIFIPEKGTAHGSTSWYAAHHILWATEHKAENYVHLSFRYHYELQLEVSPHSFKEQIERSAVLYHIQNSIINELVGLFFCIQLPQYNSELNIVERRLKDPAFITVRHSLGKMARFILTYRLNEVLEAIFGEKNPFIDEIKAEFLKNFKTDFPSK